MAEQNRPASPQSAPDPADSYERSRPEKQPGMGDLHANKATPADQPDNVHGAVTNARTARSRSTPTKPPAERRRSSPITR
jgi:hypothetical protein